jgi:hypothetical protein
MTDFQWNEFATFCGTHVQTSTRGTFTLNANELRNLFGIEAPFFEEMLARSAERNQAEETRLTFNLSFSGWEESGQPTLCFVSKPSRPLPGDTAAPAQPAGG